MIDDLVFDPPIVKRGRLSRLWRWIRWRGFRQAQLMIGIDIAADGTQTMIDVLQWRNGVVEIIGTRVKHREKPIPTLKNEP